MKTDDYKKEKAKHQEYLSKDKYTFEYPKEFMRLYYSEKFSKIGNWLCALADGVIIPITERQKEYVKNVQDRNNLKMKVGSDGKLHESYYENIFLKDVLLKENWKESYHLVHTFNNQQKTILAKILDCDANEDSIISKIFRNYYKPLIWWDDDESMYYETSYRDILTKICLKLEITFTVDDSNFILQEKITQKSFSNIIEKLSPTQKKELEGKLLKEAESLGIDVGTSSIFTLLAAGSLTGFAPYLLVTTTVGLLTSIIGVTLPFGIYTALTSGLSYILGPIGWIGASIFAISRYKKMNLKKLIPAIVLIHSFALENLQTTK